MKPLFYKIPLIFCMILMSQSLSAQVLLPGEDGQKPALSYDYFPHPQYTFIWRNWSVVDKTVLADVLQTTVRNVEDIAVSMGLPRRQHIEPEWSTTRGYMTVLKRNWHLLPYPQLLKLLAMSREELKFRLIEDDFLYIKMGSLKPYCEPLHYVEPTAVMRERAGEIAGVVRSLGRDALDCEEDRFGFMRDFDKVKKVSATVGESDSSEEAFELRMIFPYFADFGDPLLDESMSSYPEELFRRLQEVGVNGIWLHSVLRMMVEPDENGFPGDELAGERVRGLQRLVDRAAEYGIRIYLYLNEPRAMDEDYFGVSEKRKEYMGPRWGDQNSFCTSNPDVLAWLSGSLETLFSEVNGLGGVFTITASENYTSCVSRNHLACERCREHEYSDLIADLNRAIEEGVHRGDPEAKVIVWDWGWKDSECEAIIRKLPKSCWFMSVSEWAMPIEHGGVKYHVGEYSISNVGPGPRALKNWAIAREEGLKCIAKVQVNCTWEMAVVPQLPVMDLIAGHADNLTSCDVDGVMLSWSLGGYPSENLKLFQSFRKGTDASEAVERLAVEEYGAQAGPLVREAWKECSEGFSNYPFSMHVVYYSPHHVGPSNPFLLKPSGYVSTMVGFPYDHWEGWRSVYPIDVWIDLFDKCADGFERGTVLLQEAVSVADRKTKENVRTQLIRAEAVRIHLQSCAEQARFYVARDRWLQTDDPSEKAECIEIMRNACRKEQQLILDMLPVLSADSSVAYESSNQYFYLTCDLIEAYISIDHVLKNI